MIDVNNESGLEADEQGLVALARFAFEQLRLHPQVELSILLVDEGTMANLHEQHLGLPGPTDVMSFPLEVLTPGDHEHDPPPEHLGDIVLCPAVTERQAAENGRSADEEAEYLMIHGLLHLLGHDHAEPGEKAVMFGLNDQIIAAWQQHRLGD